MAIPTDNLVGYWKLLGDSQDHSGSGNHGINHGVDLGTSTFEGRGQHIEVPTSSSINPGREDFSFCALLHTDQDVDDVHGDIVSKFNPDMRRGFNFSLMSSSGGYNSIGTDRRLAFGIDDAKDGAWKDCGKPSPTNVILFSLTVFEGSLYASGSNVRSPQEASHVYRYIGGDQWEDCGRLGFEPTQGVGGMVVHNGELYGATTNWYGASAPWSLKGVSSNWDVSLSALTDHPVEEALLQEAYGRVYRYLGNKEWEDCGQPGENPRLTSLASYRGQLYALGPDDGAPYRSRAYVYEGNKKWVACGEFTNRGFPMAVHDGRLFMAHKGEPAIGDETGGARVHAFDGEQWEDLGNPLGTHARCNEIHSLGVFGGAIHIGTNPLGRVVKLEDGKWRDTGELGDSREVTALAAYNGCFYGGTLLWADVYRQERESRWQLMQRFLDEDVAPGSLAGRVPGILIPRDWVSDWALTSSLTVFGGELFASTSSCWDGYRSDQGSRGRVYRFRAGQNAAYDRDMGPGWKHVVAVKSGRRLEIFVNGLKVGTSGPFDPADYDLSTDHPLRLGSGEVDSLSGRMREVRFYKRALDQREVTSIHHESLSARDN